jgi:GT2 family glycosyltransferase
MISAVVPFFNNEDGLAATLLMLQQQTLLPDQIIILDSSKDKRGLALARRYRLPEVKIVVEIHKGNIYQAWNKGIELAGLSDCLIINDDLLLPLDTIEILDKATRLVPASALVPETPPRHFKSDHVEGGFTWLSEVSGADMTDWLTGFCFLLPRKTIDKVGLFDEKYDVWFGDTDYERRILEADGSVVRLNGLWVYHFGSSSYGRLDQENLNTRIESDRLYFESKWERK